MEKQQKKKSPLEKAGLSKTEQESKTSVKEDTLKSSSSKKTGQKEKNQLEATFSTLVLSVASSATISMGLAPHPTTKKTEKNLKMAQFNIDLLMLLEKKTKNNLLPDEENFLQSIISDLQMKFVQVQT